MGEARPHAGVDLRHGAIEGAHRAEVWDQMAQIWPDYDAYQARTERTIPLVRLEPLSPDRGAAVPFF